MNIQKANRKPIRNFVSLICLLMLGLLLFPSRAFSAPQNPEVTMHDLHTSTEHEQKTVRIGYYYIPGFQEGISDDDFKTGYGYEFIQKINTYTGWEYEYVYGSWDELVQMLETGEIDLLAGVNPYCVSSEVLLPKYHMGTENIYLFKKPQDLRFANHDFSQIPMVRIGINAKSTTHENLTRWAEQNNLTYELVAYEDENSLEQALRNSEIDLIIGSDRFFRATASCSPFIRIDTDHYYMGVAPERKDLLHDLNYAMEQLMTLEPYYLNDLQSKYYPYSALQDTLTEEELDYIYSHDRLKIGYLDNLYPFCAQLEDGSPTGLLLDYSQLLLSSLGITGHNIQTIYQAYPDSAAMEEALQNGEVDVIFPVYDSPWHNEQKKLFVSNQVSGVAMNLFYSTKQTQVDTSRIAVSKNNAFFLEYLQTHFPDSEIVQRETLEDCFDAIRSGEATCCLLTSYECEQNLNKLSNNDLKSIQLPLTAPISYGVSRGNISLLSLINHGIRKNGGDVTANILYRYLAQNNTYTLWDYLLNNIVIVSLVIVTVLTLFVLFLIFTYHSHRKLAKMQKEAFLDPLTQIQNRRSFDIIQRNLDQEHQPYALALIDIDYFKQVNDQYGHLIGDQLLQKVATMIKKTFRSQDYTFRIGGDEFAVLILNANTDARSSIAMKFSELNRQLKHPGDDLPASSLSIGVVFSSDNPKDLSFYEAADAALYEVKENGRGHVRFYK